MQYFELMMGSMIMNNISNFKTNIFWLDLLLLSGILIGVYMTNDPKINNYTKEYIYQYLFPYRNEKKITFMFKRGEQSTRCKSLFHYLSHSDFSNKQVNNLIEDIFKKYDRYSDTDKEYANIYRVAQIKPFNFTETIKGRVFTEEKESSEYNGKVVYKEHITLVIYSETESIKNLQKFVETCKVDYNKFLKDQLLEHQYIVTIETNNDKSNKDDSNNLKISKEEWSSNVTFDTRFFPEKDDIIQTINHFIENEEWYKNKGLTHTLGILLSGEPGCGKTSFIKALMNHTGRHGIEVKLNDNFDFSDLKDIIYDEEIDSNIIIPQKKRILIFEDIDAMGNIVKDRNLKEKENIDAEDKIRDELFKLISDKDEPQKNKNYKEKNSEFVKVSDKINRKDNNNLSYFLNILDGINETPGRIIIMTTNKPEILDQALIRPGRIDLRINFTKSTEQSLRDILCHYWSDKPNKDISSLDNKFTPAEIVDACRKSDSLELTVKRLFSIIAKSMIVSDSPEI